MNRNKGEREEGQRGEGRDERRMRRGRRGEGEQKERRRRGGAEQSQFLLGCHQVLNSSIMNRYSAVLSEYKGTT